MDTSEKKWYQKPGWIYTLTVLVFPIGVYLLWKSEEISKKIKIILTIVVPALAIFGGIDSYQKTKFHKQLISNGELSVHFQETEMMEGQDVQLYFRFQGNHIVSYRSNNRRYRSTGAYNTAFTHIERADDRLEFSTPFNGASSLADAELNGKDLWDILLKVQFRGIGSFEFPKDTLNGTVTIKQYVGIGSERKLVSNSYDAEFVVTIGEATEGSTTNMQEENSNVDAIVDSLLEASTQITDSSGKRSEPETPYGHRSEDEEKGIFIGTFTGTIGKKNIVIGIEKLSRDSLWGYDAVNDGAKRPLKGTFSADCDVYFITLKEPGDDKWDGVFELKMASDDFSMEGDWKSNNGKLNNPVSVKKK